MISRWCPSDPTRTNILAGRKETCTELLCADPAESIKSFLTCHENRNKALNQILLSDLNSKILLAHSSAKTARKWSNFFERKQIKYNRESWCQKKVKTAFSEIVVLVVVTSFITNVAPKRVNLFLRMRCYSFRNFM